MSVKLIDELLRLRWCTVHRFSQAPNASKPYFIACNHSRLLHVNDKGESQCGAHWFETYTEAVAAAERYEKKSRSWKLILGPGIDRSEWNKIAQLITEGKLEGDLK